MTRPAPASIGSGVGSGSVACVCKSAVPTKKPSVRRRKIYCFLVAQSTKAYRKLSIKRFLRDKLPHAESIRENRYLRWLSPWLGHPRLWHMQRDGVALGVAIGLITGLIPGPVQILLAVVIAIPLRANVLAAAAATFYTNPFTFIPLYLLAYQIGAVFTGESMRDIAPPDLSFSWWQPWLVAPAMFDWFAALGTTLLIGLAVQSVLFAVCGYVATMVIWRCVVTRLWQTRHRRSAEKKP